MNFILVIAMVTGLVNSQNNQDSTGNVANVQQQQQQQQDPIVAHHILADPALTDNYADSRKETIGELNLGRNFFEGDILLTQQQSDYITKSQSNDGLQTRAIIKDVQGLWEDGEVPFVIGDSLREESKRYVQSAIREWMKKTCVKLRPRKESDQDYVEFVYDGGCSSYVGKVGGKQTISVGSDDGSVTCKHGNIVHELAHSLGFFHEHSRPDRDEFIKIDYDNVMPGYERNFRKESFKTIDSRGVDYDYDSVMHYGAFFFTKNDGEKTIKTSKDDVSIGQRVGLSELDEQQARLLYKCDEKRKKSKVDTKGAKKSKTTTHKSTHLKKAVNSFIKKSTKSIKTSERKSKKPVAKAQIEYQPSNEASTAQATAQANPLQFDAVPVYVPPSTSQETAPAAPTNQNAAAATSTNQETAPVASANQNTAADTPSTNQNVASATSTNQNTAADTPSTNQNVAAATSTNQNTAADVPSTNQNATSSPNSNQNGVSAAVPTNQETAKLASTNKQAAASTTTTKAGTPNLILTDDDLAEENLGQSYFEGDMILSDDQRQYLESLKSDTSQADKRALIKNTTYLWPDRVVYYTFDDSVDKIGRENAEAALLHWQEKTCLTFKHRSSEKDYINFVFEGGCASRVGRGGGMQKLTIGSTELRCKKGNIIHEMGHALGFFHEHSRPDRDDFVSVHSNNIMTGYERNFLKFSTRFIDSLNVPYDYGSIMHYGKAFFSKLSGLLPTMTIEKEADEGGDPIEIGQRVSLSDMDVLQANLLYKCDGRKRLSDDEREELETDYSDPMVRMGPCTDSYNALTCSNVKSKGYCHRYPRTMRSACGNTCQLCSTTPPTHADSLYTKLKLDQITRTN